MKYITQNNFEKKNIHGKKGVLAEVLNIKSKM